MLPLWAEGVYEALSIITLQKRVGVAQKTEDLSEKQKELTPLGPL